MDSLSSSQNFSLGLTSEMISPNLEEQILKILISIKSLHSIEEERIPLRLVLVVDTSVSMKGININIVLRFHIR